MLGSRSGSGSRSRWVVGRASLLVVAARDYYDRLSAYKLLGARLQQTGSGHLRLSAAVRIDGRDGVYPGKSGRFGCYRGCCCRDGRSSATAPSRPQLTH